MPYVVHRPLIKAIRVDSVRKIAVFRALYLGDLLCATPALRALCHHFRSAEITLIGLPWAADLVNRLPFVDRLLEFPGYPSIAEVPYQQERTNAFLAAAHAEQYDLVIQMHGGGDVSNGFVADLGGRFSLGYRQEHDDRLDHSLLYDPSEHETLRWLRLVAEVGARSADTQLALPITAAEQARAAVLLRDNDKQHGPFIGVHTGAKDAARRWPAERFAALANTLVQQFNALIVLTGSAAEQQLAAAVEQSLRQPALNLVGQTDLGTFAALLSQLDLLVTNDTGASHIAAATHTPSVVLFGPTRPERWAPLDGQRHRVVDAQALMPGVDPDIVLAHLSVDSVLQVCSEILTRQGDHDRSRMGKQMNGSNLVLEV